MGNLETSIVKTKFNYMKVIQFNDTFILEIRMCNDKVKEFCKISLANENLFHGCKQVVRHELTTKFFHIENCTIKRADLIRRLLKYAKVI